MRRFVVVSVVFGAVWSAAPAAQAPSAPATAFDVASVKVNDSGTQSSSSQYGKGLVRITNQTLRLILVNAFGVRPDRIVGGPDWMDSLRFDVVARAPESTPDSQLDPMMRALLAERFKLETRPEIREEPVYGLVLSRDAQRLGPNLRPSAECTKSGGTSGVGVARPAQKPGQPRRCGLWSGSDLRGTVIEGGSVTMASLARALDGLADRPVVDRTGLTGTYDLDLRFARTAVAVTADTDANAPSIFVALPEQLGLKLESQRGPVEFLAVDRVEKPTAD